MASNRSLLQVKQMQLFMGNHKRWLLLQYRLLCQNYPSWKITRFCFLCSYPKNWYRKLNHLQPVRINSWIWKTICLDNQMLTKNTPVIQTKHSNFAPFNFLNFYWRVFYLEKNYLSIYGWDKKIRLFSKTFVKCN